MKLITGPVLGQISGGHIRILIEVDSPGIVELKIFPLDKGLRKNWPYTPHWKVFRVLAPEPEPFRPFVMVLDGLPLGLDYGYKIIERGSGEILMTSSFHMADNREPLKVLVVSCNAMHMLREGQLDLWECMKRDYAEVDAPRVDMLLHIGDQIYEYARDVWKRCYHYMLTVQHGGGITTGEALMAADKELGYEGEWVADPGPCDLEYVKGVMTELFRSLYRQNWSHPPTRHIMSRISNQMILDDHDIRNGWGIIEEDRKEDTIEYTIGQAAHRAYQEYQAHLWRDIDNKYHVDHRILRRGDKAIFIMDVRNPRTFCYNSKAPYMGYEQMKTLKDLLRDQHLTDLMVVCSIPIILSSEQVTEIASKLDITCDVRDQWCQGPNKAEHCDLLSILAEWKRSNPQRNLLLVGGDIHMGLVTTIKDRGEPFCTQLVTSPITNEATTALVGWLQDTFVRDNFTLYRRFNVKHTERIHARNYAMILNAQEGWKHVLHQE